MVPGAIRQFKIWSEVIVEFELPQYHPSCSDFELASHYWRWGGCKPQKTRELPQFEYMIEVP
jgi:hypothetical protein